MSFNIERLARITEARNSIETINDPGVTCKQSNFTPAHCSSSSDNCDCSYSAAHPLSQHTSNKATTDSWYYLFDRASAYCHHMLALDKLRSGCHHQTVSEHMMPSSNGTTGTHDSNVEDNSKINPLNTRLDDSSLLGKHMDNVNKCDTAGAITRFLIPHSDEGYGFTLAVVNRATFEDAKSLHSTSTPSVSPVQENRTRNSSPLPSNICIHAVRKSSPAAEVGLPVGAYLVEVGHERLNSSTTLKEAVKRLRQVSKLREDKSMPLGVVLSQECNTNFSPPVTNGGSKNEDCLSVISSISGMSNGFARSVQATHPPATNMAELVSSPLANSFRSLSVSTSSTAWPGLVTYPHYSSLHRSSPADVNDGSSFSAEVASLGSVGHSQLSSVTCAMLCEERCIDPDNQYCLADGENSLLRRKRLLTLAPPILSLRWCDVTPQEARRQWAIAQLIAEVDRVANELLAGVRAYRLGLRRTANLTKEELELLFRNITQIASQAWRLSQRLQGACLAYATSSDAPLNSVHSYSATRSTVHQTVTNALESRKPNLFARIRKSIVNNPRNTRTKAPRNTNGHNREESTRSEPLKSPIEGDLSNPDQDQALKSDIRISIDPPPHGHLDSPGRIVHGSVDALLTEYAVYTHEHLTRMKQVREFRRHHPELRSLLRAHAMGPGVPSFGNFLALPLEFLLILLLRLQKIQAHTNGQHSDRPYLDRCISMLREAVLSRSAVDDATMVHTPHASRAGTLQPPSIPIRDDENHQSSGDGLTHPAKQSSSSAPFHDKSLDKCCQPRSSSANRELAQLFRSLELPLYPSPDSEMSNELVVWTNAERHIIFRGALDCTLSNAQLFVDGVADSRGQLYIGMVFAYLLTDALVLVASDTDVLTSNESKPLLCDPVMLKFICNQTYDAELYFVLETIGGLHLRLGCQTVEDKLVWKTLIQQRIAMIQ